MADLMATPDKNLTPLQQRKKKSMSIGSAADVPELQSPYAAGEPGAEFDSSTSTGDWVRLSSPG
jgi:hypothetical protein